MDLRSWCLLGLLAASVVVLIALINSSAKWHPFVALLVVGVGTAVAAGEPLEAIPETLTRGAGQILGEVGVTVALGAVLGRLMADSGASARIAAAITARASDRVLPWLMGLAAFVIGVPMFFEVGLVMLLPITYAIAREMEERSGRTGRSWALLAVPAVASLSALHGMVPPHPGPLVAINGLHANLGQTILVGLVCAVPAAVLAGPLYARWVAPRVPLSPDAALARQFAPATAQDEELRAQTPLPVVLAVLAVPVALMLGRAVAEVLLPRGSLVARVAALLGHPVLAMLCGVVVAMLALGGRPPFTGEHVRRSVGEAVKSVASILLVIGAGGAFQGVMTDSGIGKAVTHAASAMQLSLPVLGWSVALLLSLCTGSATVGVVSATTIVAPLAAGATSWELSLLVVAIGAGSVGLNYVNHAGFWLVKEALGMDLAQAAKTHTAAQTIVSVIGLVAATALFPFV